MKVKKVFNVFLALMLVFMAVTSTALALPDPEEDDDANDDTVIDDDDDLMDRINSEDEVLGYEKNHDYELSDDLSVQEGFDSASSLPGWGLLVLIILLLVVVLIIFVPSVFGVNIFKGGRAALSENPVEAAQGIKHTKKINRSYFEAVMEAVGFIALIWFAIGFFK